MIRTASKAIIIKDDCLLAIKMYDSGEDFYVLPGGGQENGENLHANLQRECLEEVGVPVEIGSLCLYVIISAATMAMKTTQDCTK
jgi:8-oxo-dGTP diphosphatase